MTTLEESDAFRRGLRYGDEIVSFGGRPISTSTASRTCWAFSQGLARAAYLSPQGRDYDILVRLPACIAMAELAQVVADGPQNEPERMPSPRRRARQTPIASEIAGPRAPKPEPMPEIVKQHFVAKPRLRQLLLQPVEPRPGLEGALWHAATMPGAGQPWTSDGQNSTAEDVPSSNSPTSKRRSELPGRRTGDRTGGELAGHLEPPGSGGLLVAWACGGGSGDGTDRFGDVYYWARSRSKDTRGWSTCSWAAMRDVECHSSSIRPADSWPRWK